ncbi:hypothetical protein TRSC58_02790 [Trypanosoma rangeli SC58]|uniref:Uncharacterized protein n=1 Tax=Trypanosoma rangeli SC58 TaxID=429131 RepID=A0A061J854_TRYRA|nr:hypothetical protein TRSC58_02790 [Trypanosoma rangeli SC58]
MELLGVVVQQLIEEVGANRHRLPYPGGSNQKTTPHVRCASRWRGKHSFQITLDDLPHPMHLNVNVAVGNKYCIVQRVRP